MKSIKISLLIVNLLILLSCNIDDKKKNTVKYFYVIFRRDHFNADTIPTNDINNIDSTYKLIATEGFYYLNKVHHINLYSDDDNSPMDGGALKYTLDSIGLIYERSTTWPNFIKLTTNNDSLNDLISIAYSAIIMFPSMRCYHCDEKHTHVLSKDKLDIDKLDIDEDDLIEKN